VPQNGTASNGAGASGTADSGRAQTPDERRGAIDKRLDDSLGTFDQQIRKEQERNAQERDARNAANAGTAQQETDSQQDGDIASGGSASTEGPDKGERQSRPGDLKSDKDRKKSEGSGSNGPQGASGGDARTEIPDGSDDDVVARRLRKAAEAETDPELKEKLWKEYIEYKKAAK